VPRSRGFTGTARSRRRSSWEIGPQTGVDGAAIAIASSSLLVGNGGAVVLADGPTLVRLRGELNLFLTLSGGVGDGFHGAFGVAIANEDAFAAGVGSLMTPITEEDWDGWIYHSYFGIFSGGPVAAATTAKQQELVNPGSAVVHREVDSKAMRKLIEHDTIYCALEVVELGNCTMEWAFNSRMLVKLP